MTTLPTGTVTFLFTDLEGQTPLWEEHPEAMRAAVARHDAVLREAVAAHGGQVVKMTGDGLHAAFARAPDALGAALDAQRALAVEPWDLPRPLRARMGLHAGACEERGGDYYGPAVNRAARVMAAGHGGQVLLSQVTAGLVRGELPAGADLRDLGEHRLRDLQEPERLFQLVASDLPDRFPPPRTLGAHPNNLPLQLTSFVGRERELAEVRGLLAGSRLVTLTGTGGCGKTRLALQVAAEVLDAHPDGAWFVDLAPVADEALVAQAALAALGLRDAPDRPPLERLVEHLRGRGALVVLDNCEHLVAACARLVDALLRVCPRLRVLATSRELLGVAGEAAWRVPSLTLPDAGGAVSAAALARCEAVQLLAERARLVQPGFAVTAANGSAVAQVCRRLDGIPLALELAAARVRGMTVEQVAARLDDRFRLLTGGTRTALRRQQTLRAMVDWSHDLLAEPERAVLRRLAVFAGGFALEAAEAVCAGDAVEPADVLDLLLQLVDKSLVLAEEREGAERYRLLETVRQYAEERLLDAGEAARTRARHRDWYLALAERAAPALTGPDQRAWMRTLEAEHDNLRAAIEWSRADPAGAEAELRLCAALGRFWRSRTPAEGLARLLEALARADPAPTPARSTALNWAGYLAGQHGDVERGERLLEEAVAVARAVGEPSLLTIALRHLSAAPAYQGEGRGARLLDEALAVARAADDARETGWTLLFQARAAHGAGDLDRARRLTEEAASMARRAGDASTLAPALANLGRLGLARGDLAMAREAFEEALVVSRACGHVDQVVFGLALLGDAARLSGEPDAARARYREALRASHVLGPGEPAVQALTRLAGLEAVAGSTERAARLFAASGAWRARAGRPAADHRDPWRYASTHGSDLAAVRAHLGEPAVAAAWAEGEAMPLEEAIADALEDSNEEQAIAPAGPSRAAEPQQE